MHTWWQRFIILNHKSHGLFHPFQPDMQSSAKTKPAKSWSSPDLFWSFINRFIKKKPLKFSAAWIHYLIFFCRHLIKAFVIHHARHQLHFGLLIQVKIPFGYIFPSSTPLVRTKNIPDSSLNISLCSYIARKIPREYGVILLTRIWIRRAISLKTLCGAILVHFFWLI